MKVGFPKYKPTGDLANHHLPHSVSNPVSTVQYLFSYKTGLSPL